MISSQILLAYEDSIKYVAQNISCYFVDPISDFTRRRKLPEDILLKLIIQMQDKNSNSELCDFFEDCDKIPTSSAFIQQRNKLLVSAFKKIDSMLVNSFVDDYKKFKDYFILAADGSDINISFDPNDKETYRENGRNKPYSQFHLNALYDCLNDIYWDYSIDTATKKRECDALKEMAMNHNYPSESIITIDRGYEKYALITYFIENKQKFLMRVKDITSSTSILTNINFTEEEFDADIVKKLTNKQTNETKNGHYTILTGDTTIDYFNEDGFYDLKLRVIRFKLSEDTYECLITNLDREEFSTEELKEMYNKRWSIECSFCQLKYSVPMIYFHSKSRRLIQQEIAASILLFNLTKLLDSAVDVKEAADSKQGKYEYMINFTVSVTNIRKWIQGLITDEELIKRLKKYLVPKRPDRSYKRDVKPQAYKHTAHRVS